MYRNIDPRYLGTRALTKRLTEVLERNINKHMRSILKEINEKSKECEDVIKSLGQPMPKEGKEKIYLIWKLLTEFTEQYKAAIKGKSKDHEEKVDKELKLSVGSIIKSMFEELYEDESAKDFKITQDLSDEDIERAIKNHQGDSIPGFPSIHAFLYLLSPRLQKLKEPALDLLNNIYTELRKLSGELITEVAQKAPSIMDEMINLTDAFLLELKNKTEKVMIDNIDSEIGYIFTNDEEYLNKRTKLIPRAQTEEAKPKVKQDDGKKDDKKDDKKEERRMPDTKEERERLKREAEKMFVRELRLRVEHYFQIVIRTLRVFVSLCRKSSRRILAISS